MPMEVNGTLDTNWTAIALGICQWSLYSVLDSPPGPAAIDRCKYDSTYQLLQGKVR